MNAYKNGVILGILFGNSDSAFGDAFVQLDGIEPTHSVACLKNTIKSIVKVR